MGLILQIKWDDVMVQRKMNNLWKAALSLYFQWQSVSFPVTISDECHRERLARRRMCSDLSHPIGISCLWLSCFGSPSPRLQSHGWRQASTNNQTLPFEAQSKEWWSESTANLITKADCLQDRLLHPSRNFIRVWSHGDTAQTEESTEQSVR